MRYSTKIAKTLFNNGFTLKSAEAVLISEIFKTVSKDFETKTQISFIMNDPDFISDVLDDLA
jgi:hypothetical protein